MNRSHALPLRPPFLAVLIGAAALTVSAGRAQEACGTWEQVPAPAGATLAVTDVEVASFAEAWAFATPLGIVRWDGGSWAQFPVPDPNGDYPIIWFRELGLVGDRLFLAGNGETGPFSSDLTLRTWDGSAWSDWSSLTLQPNASGGARNGAAREVVGVAPDDVWLVGNANGLGTGVGGDPPLLVHWNGDEMTEFLVAGIGNRRNELEDAVALASDDVWAVGLYENVATPPLGFHGAIYHWDGNAWSPVPGPTDEMSSTGLTSVTAVSPTDVWAAGHVGNRPLFLHWDGEDWSVVPAPDTTGSIQQMVAVASDDVWAVDAPAQVPTISKYYHWDGDAWSVVTPPEIPGAISVSRHGGLAAVGPCDVWAVGSADFGAGIVPFVERLQGGGLMIFADGFESGIPSGWTG